MVGYTQIEQAEARMHEAMDAVRLVESMGSKATVAMRENAYRTMATCQATLADLNERMFAEIEADIIAELDAEDAAAVAYAVELVTPMPELVATEAEATDLARNRPHGRFTGPRCLSCRVNGACIDMEEKNAVCCSCAWTLIHRKDFPFWDRSVQRTMIGQLNAACGKG